MKNNGIPVVVVIILTLCASFAIYNYFDKKVENAAYNDFNSGLNNLDKYNLTDEQKETLKGKRQTYFNANVDRFGYGLKTKYSDAQYNEYGDQEFALIKNYELENSLKKIE